MILRVYKTERKYNSGKQEMQVAGEFPMLKAIVKGMSTDEWYMAVIYDIADEGDISYDTPLFARFNSSGAEYYYFPKEYVNYINAISYNAYKKSESTCIRTLSLVNNEGSDDLCLVYSDGKTKDKVISGHPFKASDDVLWALGKVEEYVKGLGFKGIESILITPRRVGKYKTACAAMSRSESGNARITVDLH